MLMEKTISASFRSLQDLQHAAHALRKQGAIDIRMGISPPHPNQAASEIVSAHSMTRDRLEIAEELTYAYTFDVYVEPSRSRQAEDTIVRYGGRFNIFPES